MLDLRMLAAALLPFMVIILSGPLLLINMKGPWIFGYGSLVWRPNFRFLRKSPAYIEGWSRRFWQGSTDHRGIPGSPGRVVTLKNQVGEICWGMAYQIAEADGKFVISKLNFREKGGYQLLNTKVYLKEVNETVEGNVYIAMPANPNYLGEATIENIAAQIVVSKGPSGPNDEYVFKLAGALREIGVHDPHTFEIEKIIRQQSKIS